MQPDRKWSNCYLAKVDYFPITSRRVLFLNDLTATAKCNLLNVYFLSVIITTNVVD